MLNFKMNMPFYLIEFYGSIMIAVVLLLRCLMKKKLPKFVFPALWSVVILRFLVPFSLSSPLSMKVPEFSMESFFHTSSATATTSVAVAAEDIPSEISMMTDDIPAVKGTAPIAQEQELSEVIVSDAVSSAFETAYYGYNSSSVYHALILFGFAGIIITAGILLSQKYSYTKRLKDSLLIEHNETINTLLRDMDMGHILVFTNDEIASPLVCGLFSPRIYLPTRMDFANTELLHHILCHEAMHIRRKDNWIKAAMLLTLCVHWFNPLVWVMSKCLASDLEMACDEAVLRLYQDDEAQKNYAFSLLTMAITGNRTALLYSAFSKTEVEKRIQNIIHYKKSSALLTAFSLCLVMSGSIVFATGGQSPFQPYLSSSCASSNCHWIVKAYLTRGASLGENAGKRADTIILDILSEDTTNDPDILENHIKDALSKEFHVERGAFTLDLSLYLDHEELFAEYAKWGLVRKEKDNDMPLLYNGETIRTYSDQMLGRYYSQQEGSVDITIIRNRLGDITSVNALHAGDAEFDRRTREIEHDKQLHARFINNTYSISDATEETVVQE